MVAKKAQSKAKDKEGKLNFAFEFALTKIRF
jgi:hypothetical protein